MVDTDDTRCTTDDRRRTTPWVWHKLPTGELKKRDGPLWFTGAQLSLLFTSFTKLFIIPQHSIEKNYFNKAILFSE